MNTRVDLRLGDCLDVLKDIEANSIDAVVCDPPYHLTSIVKRFGGSDAAPAQFGTDGAFARASRGFMGQSWDGGDIAFRSETWLEVFRVLKPGGHLLAFSGTRTYHRMAVAIEDAGFEIRDMIQWMYGSGFPKSHNVALGIDKAAGLAAQRAIIAENPSFRETPEEASAYKFKRNEMLTAPASEAAKKWDGWGTALKPAQEPICVGRKPLIGSVAENVQAHGTGALNIDACRVPTDSADDIHAKNPHTVNVGSNRVYGAFSKDGSCPQYNPAAGRWPANVIHDGSDEVLEAFAAYGERGASAPVKGTEPSNAVEYGARVFNSRSRTPSLHHPDTGTAARFFYCAKAARSDRDAGLDEAFEKKPLNWSSGDANPGSFQSEGTDKSARNPHPTVKPTELMRYLCRLVTPPDGVVLDPFMGSGSTGRGAVMEGFRFIGIEREAEYMRIAEARIADAVVTADQEERRRYEASRQLDLFGVGDASGGNR